MNSKLRIAFGDFWNDFSEDCFLVKEIKQNPNIVCVNENPDLAIASVFGQWKHFIKRNNPGASLLTISWECYQRWNNIVPGSYFNSDYLFMNNDMDSIPVRGKYSTFQSSAAIAMMDLDKEYPPQSELNEKLSQREFCSFVFSNASSDPGAVFRNDLFHELSKYKFVSAAGPCNNNYGKMLSRERKDALEYFSNYKFNIACENTSAPGYITEKIFNAYTARSVPIYWGDSSIKETFNPDSFIFATSINETVKRIIELDNDPEAYMKMLSTPPFKRLPSEYSREHFIFSVNAIINEEYKMRYHS